MTPDVGIHLVWIVAPWVQNVLQHAASTLPGSPDIGNFLMACDESGVIAAGSASGMSSSINQVVLKQYPLSVNLSVSLHLLM